MTQYFVLQKLINLLPRIEHAILLKIHHNPITRQTKTHFNLKHQPRKHYRLFIPQSKLFDSWSVARN